MICLPVLGEAPDPGGWDAAFGDPGLRVAVLGAATAAAGPSAMTVDPAGNVYLAGGNWNELDGTPFEASPGYATWNRATGEWSPFGRNAGAAGVFEMLATGPDSVYVGGQWTFFFDGAALIQTQGVVRWNGSSWSPLGSGLSGGLAGLPASVEAMAMDGHGNLYVGGLFTTAGGIPARNVARWDGSGWSAVGDGLDSRVSTLAFGPDGTLYAGGVFNEGQLRRVARWNGTSWQPMAAGFTSGEVTSFAFDGAGNVYAGGSFQFISDPNLGLNFTPASRVARWNGAQWHPLGPGVNATVRSLAFGNGTLFAGGQFTATGDSSTAIARIAAWNGNDWEPLGEGTDRVDGPTSEATVFHLLVSSGPDAPARRDLVLGGPFDRAGGHVANNIALWSIGSGGGSTTGPTLSVNSDGGGVVVTFPSESGTRYDVLFAPVLTGNYTVIDSLEGTGGALTFPIGEMDGDQGFYRVLAVPGE